jgi:4-diphosphocytidyl-2-C-methyl-D-erythritol kinase
VTEDAPAKINLCLFVGPTREDGRHELVSVMESISLADTLHLEPLDAGEDAVVCDGVEDTLVTGALRAFRAATGWDGGPVRITIDKRIPVAAGLGGGSADAAAALRLAGRASGLGDDDTLHALAARLGSDVPGQVRPGRVLATGAGEHVERLDPPAPYGVLVLPSRDHLSTPAVYAEADRLGLPRDAEALAAALAEVRGAARPPAVNDLQDAARSLCPSIDEALAAARDAGARDAFVAGSGPTVLGLFDTPEEAERAAERLAARDPRPIAARPVCVSSR